MNIKRAKRLRHLICHLAQALASGNREGGRRLQGSSHILPLKMPLGREAIQGIPVQSKEFQSNPRNPIQSKELLVEVKVLLTLHTAQRALSAQEHYNLEQVTFKLCFPADFSPEPSKTHLFLNTHTRVLRGQVGATTLWPPPTASSSP